jgi:hypothetical protein
MGEGGDVIVSELGHSVSSAVSAGRLLRVPMRIQWVLKGLPWKLVSGKVILFPVLLGNAMGMRRHVVQFGGPLVVLVMGSVIVTSRHIQCLLKTYDLAGLGVGFLGELVSALRVLQCAFRMPASRLVIPFFIVFGSSTMGACRKFVLFGGFPMSVAHCRSLLAV